MVRQVFSLSSVVLPLVCRFASQADRLHRNRGYFWTFPSECPLHIHCVQNWTYHISPETYFLINDHCQSKPKLFILITEGPAILWNCPKWYIVIFLTLPFDYSNEHIFMSSFRMGISWRPVPCFTYLCIPSF